MSMLAERKRKQKWSLNPRGKDWAQDSNKFGQKLLEKMGWQQGKGLGAKEDGITEHVKVSYKNDSKGMGYKESDDQWTEHETNFSALLKSLTGDAAVPKEIKRNSLEKKSQTSRARVHYHKFTRGKDLSRYSEKDLANIFGKKSLTKEEKDCKQVNNSDESGESASKFLLNAGSMRDYFKKKLPSFGKSAGYFVGSNGVLTKGESDSESEITSSFGLGYKESDRAGFGFLSEVNSNQECSENATNIKATFVSYINGEGYVESGKNIKKKRKSVPRNGDTNFSPKKTCKRDNDTPLGVSNPAFDPLRTPVKIQKHILNTIEESAAEEDFELVETEVEIHEEMSRKEKELENYQTSKKKKVKCKENGLENPNLNVSIDESVYEIKSMERKKTPFDSSVMKADSIEDVIGNIQENPYKGKIKRKKKKNCVTDPSASENVDENSYELKIKEKKKKKTLKAALENPAFNYSSEKSFEMGENNENCAQNIYVKWKNKEKLSVMNELEEKPFEVQNKKKKRKHREETFAMDNPEFDPNDSLNTSSINNAVEVERKTKKLKKSKEEIGVANPTLSLNSSHSENEESFEDSTKSSANNMFEIDRKRKKSKKIKEVVGVANPALRLENSLMENEENFVTSGVNNMFEVERRKKKSKKVKEELGVKNLCLENEEVSEDLPLRSTQSNNAFEVERKKKKSKKIKEETGIINPALDLNTQEICLNLAIENAHFEESSKDNALTVERKKKAKKIKEEAGVVNPALYLNSLHLNKDENFEDSATENAQFEESGNNSAIGVERKKKKSKKIEEEPGIASENVSVNAECDLMLNVVTTPVIATPKVASLPTSASLSVKRRKSVRFSDVTQERIIPNNDDLRSMGDVEYRRELFGINKLVIDSSEKQGGYAGLDNIAFDSQKTKLEENLESISKTIDKYQAQVENDINEKKLEGITMEDIMIGEVGNPDGEHEKLPDGTKLKFRYAHFESKTPFYQLDKTGSRKSYKHLIKGDIVVKFRNTNLHEIDGYAVRSKSTVV